MAEKKMKCHGLDNDSGSGTGREEHRENKGGGAHCAPPPRGLDIVDKDYL